MKRIAIMGLGLMGGSLGLALKSRHVPTTVVGYARREETRGFAIEHGLVDEVFDQPGDAVRDADMVVLCLPIMANVSLLQQCKEDLRAATLVTDVGSTKAEMTARIGTILAETGASYVGSHPVAGSEKQGAGAAVADLYQDALVIVSTSPTSSDAEVRKITEFWEGLGSVVLVQSPAEHDQWMARTSHLPHLVAAALVATVGRGKNLDEIRTFCGTGFRDTTRVAEGSPTVWLDILQTNRQNVLLELASFREQIDELYAKLAAEEDSNVGAFLKECGDVRRSLMGATGKTA